MYMTKKIRSDRKTQVKYVFDTSNDMTEIEIVNIINSITKFESMHSIIQHFDYIKHYVRKFNNTSQNIKIISDIQKYLDNNFNPNIITNTYILMCNEIKSIKYYQRNDRGPSIFDVTDQNIPEINIRIPVTVPREIVLTSTVCALCNTVLKGKEKECACGCVNSGSKTNNFYGTNNMIYVKIPRNMHIFLNNLSCNFYPNSDNLYLDKLDRYFISINREIGENVSKLFSTNMEKISHGYTLLALYDALSACKIEKPKTYLYFYAYIYWNWDYIRITPDIIKLCSDIYNIFESHRKSQGYKKVPIEYCAWWFLYNFGIETNLRVDYKRSKSDDVITSRTEHFSILENFSNDMGLRIPPM